MGNSPQVEPKAIYRDGSSHNLFDGIDAQSPFHRPGREQPDLIGPAAAPLPRADVKWMGAHRCHSRLGSSSRWRHYAWARRLRGLTYPVMADRRDDTTILDLLSGNHKQV
jgi:hypothetical protein